MTRRGGLLAGLLLALGLLLAPAHAATHSVQLTANGPAPAHLSLRPGDQVVFVNADSVPHQITSQGSWQYDSGPVPPGQTSTATPALTAPGTYSYSDVRGIVLLPQTFHGTLVVPKPAPAPPPTATPTPHRSQSPAPTRTPDLPPPATVGPTASASPAPSLSAVPVGSPATTTSPAPLPSVAPNIPYGGAAALVQSSPHAYGLPALLALVAMGGVASLIGRYLLALAPARR